MPTCNSNRFRCFTFIQHKRGLFATFRLLCGYHSGDGVRSGDGVHSGMVSIRGLYPFADGVHIGMASIRDGVHLGWCPFAMASISEWCHLGSRPFGIVSIRDCVLRYCVFRDPVHSGNCSDTLNLLSESKKKHLLRENLRPAKKISFCDKLQR